MMTQEVSYIMKMHKGKVQFLQRMLMYKQVSVKLQIQEKSENMYFKES